MMISNHFFHVLSFVLFLSFSFSFAHFRDVTPFEEFDSKSFNSHSSAPSPSPASFMSSITSDSSDHSAAGSGSLSDSSNSKGSGSSKTSDSSLSSTASGSLTSSGFLSGSSNSKGSGITNSGSSNSKDSGSSIISDYSSSSDASGSPTDSGSLSGSSNSEDSGSSKTSDSLSGSGSILGSSNSKGSDSSTTFDSSSGFGSSGSFKGSGSLSGSGNSLGSDDFTASGSFTSFGNFVAPGPTNLGSSTGTGSSAASGPTDLGPTNSGSSTSTSSSNAYGSANVGSSAGFGISAGSDSSNSADYDSSTSSDASNSKEDNNKTNLNGSFSAVFAFGDSYTDTGNAQLLGILKNFVGALLTSFFQGTNSNFKLGGRSSNGRLVVDFLCDALNIPTLQPYKAISANSATNDGNSGVNFAIGGATSLSGDFFANHKIGHTLLWKGIPLGFQTQIEWFNKFVTEIACKGKSEEECKIEMGNRLIWLGQMGVDDFARVIGSSISMRWLTDITIDHISKILTTVLDSGAKFFVVQGLPPLGCCPLAKLLTPQSDKDEMGCSSVINRAVMAHNELLQKTLEEFRGKHGSEIIISYADYFNAYKTIVGNLAGFGFSDGSQACCGVGGGPLNFNLHNLCGMVGTNTCSNPDGHVHWDGLHLTEAMHKQITRLFLQEGFCKPSFADLISRRRNLHI